MRKLDVMRDGDAHKNYTRVRRLEAVCELGEWMARFPELFGTRVQYDCFVMIGLLATGTGRISTLSHLYRRLPYAENSVRSYLRNLEKGGWIQFVRDGEDRRAIGLRMCDRMLPVYEEYFALLEAIGQFIPPASAEAGHESVGAKQAASAMEQMP